MSNLTFAIIKPDAVRAGNTGRIIQRISDHGFRTRGLKMLHMTLKQAEGFYAVHLEREGAVKAWRDLMGATDPAKAEEGTIRKEFGSSVGENATHGSDSDENAAIEIAYFFSALELV